MLGEKLGLTVTAVATAKAALELLTDNGLATARYDRSGMYRRHPRA